MSTVTAAALPAFPTHNLGYPRIGAHRELKRALEGYWRGQLSGAELARVGADVRRANWNAQREAGVDLIPSNDFSFYDGVLDTAALVGAVPPRFGWDGQGDVGLDLCFAMARGVAHGADGRERAPGAAGVPALEMTKWFDTNYHYLVPEFDAGMTFRLVSPKPFDEFQEALALGVRTKPVLLGPVSFLLLGKGTTPGFEPLTLLDRLLPVYAEALGRLAALGAGWVQMDEPTLARDLTPAQRAAFPRAYAHLRADVPATLRLLVATYFGALGDNLPTALALPVEALHYDSTRGSEAEVAALAEGLQPPQTLSLGVVDGRNVWRNDFARSLAVLTPAAARLGPERLWVAPSCSLLHAPQSLAAETSLDPELRGWLAFAEEKLGETVTLARALRGEDVGDALAANRESHAARCASARIHRPAVKARAAAVIPDQMRRSLPYAERAPLQRTRFALPPLPTTTIGSFPQTETVRLARARFRNGELNAADYEAFLREETRRTVRLQEELGLDVLVHGEFERTDMVEYFGERLEGFAFTRNGWVQSYGSRCVKPPVLFGDVARPAPMTVEWSRFAQGLTDRPMKAMLTGPVTILQWSFVRDDQPRSDTCRQLALALRDEVADLEAAGLGIIQMDEPALREGLPLRRAEWAGYLRWATDCFRLSAAGASRADTQVHTHMCYCDYGQILGALAAMDADVISLEASRSGMELLGDFAHGDYPNEVGPGVWDIHSPRVPTAGEMTALLAAAETVLPRERLWVNPDCGLKTRAWAEVEPALRHLVTAARARRSSVQEAPTNSGEAVGV